MKKFNRLIAFTAMSVSLSGILMLSGCSAAMHSAASSNDGMYGVHDRVQIANRQREAAELRRAEAEARKAELEARLAEAQVLALENDYYDYPVENSYTSVVADTYESAYMRRLKGFTSPSYRMPSSYYNLRYGGSFNYVTAYDPAFYNIMVSGDQVWVEPKYISSMFGSWGATNVTFGLSIYPYSWYYGWNRPFYSSAWWGFPHYSWYDWNWGVCYNPYRWWGYGWFYGGGPGWGPGGHRPPSHGYTPRPQPQRQNIVSNRQPTRYQSPSSGKNYGTGGYGGSRGTINGSGTFRPNNGQNGGTQNSRPTNSGTQTRNRTNTGSGSYNNNTNRGGSSSFFNNNNSSSGNRSQGGSSYNGGSSGGSRGGSGYSGGSGGSSGGGGGRGNSIGR